MMSLTVVGTASDEERLDGDKLIPPRAVYVINETPGALANQFGATGPSQ